jgi:hypothetical protein
MIRTGMTRAAPTVAYWQSFTEVNRINPRPLRA